MPVDQTVIRKGKIASSISDFLTATADCNLHWALSFTNSVMMVPNPYFFSSVTENLSQIWDSQLFFKVRHLQVKTNKPNKELPPVSVSHEKFVLLE